MSEINPYAVENRNKFKWCGRAGQLAWEGFVRIERHMAYRFETCLYWKNGCDDCKDIESKCDQSSCSCKSKLPDLHS